MRLHPDLGEGRGHLRGALRVGAESAADHRNLRGQPAEVGAFEGAVASDAAEDRHAAVGKAAGDPALFAGAHGRCRASHDGA